MRQQVRQESEVQMKEQTIEKQKDGTWTLKLAHDPTIEDKADVELASSSGFLDGITRTEVAGVPIGSAVVGGALAILVDRVIVTYLDKEGKWGMWANLAGAFAIKKWGSKWLGANAANAAALFLVYEAVADTVSGFIDGVWPKPAAAAGQQNLASEYDRGYAGGLHAQGLEQPMPTVTGGYYDKGMRR